MGFNIGSAFSQATRGVGSAFSNASRDVGRAVDNLSNNVGRAVSGATRDLGSSFTSAPRAVSSPPSSTPRAVSPSFSSVTRSLGSSFSSFSSNLGGSLSSTSRSLGNSFNGLVKSTSNLLSPFTQRATNTAPAAQGSPLTRGAQELSRRYNGLITESYRDAKALQQSSNPFARAVGNSSVGVRDGIAGLNGTVDEAERFWKDLGGPLGTIGQGLVSLGKGITAPLRAVDHTATDAQRNAAVIESGITFVTGGLGKVAGPAFKALGRTPLGRSTVQGVSQLTQTQVGRQLARVPQVASWLNNAPARALSSSQFGRALLGREAALRASLSTLNRFGEGRLSEAARQTVQALRSKPLVQLNINRGNNSSFVQEVFAGRVRVGGNLDAASIQQSVQLGGKGRINININSFNNNTVQQSIFSGSARVGGDLNLGSIRQSVQVGSGGLDINIRSLRNLRIQQQLGLEGIQVGGRSNVGSVRQSVQGLPRSTAPAQVHQTGARGVLPSSNP